MSVNTSSNSDSFGKEYVSDVFINLPASRIYRGRKILYTRLDIIMIIFLNLDFGKGIILLFILG